MKLWEAIYSIDRSQSNTVRPDLEHFCEVLGLDRWDYGSNEDVFEARMTAYWLNNWCCTDTTVGTRVYFLDGEFVAIGYQSARKNPNDITFVSNAAAIQVRDFILSLGESRETQFPLISEKTLNEELGKGYRINYTGALENQTWGWYNGEKVWVDIQPGRMYKRDSGDDPYINDKVRVYTETNPTKFKISIRDILFPWHCDLETDSTEVTVDDN